MTSLFSSSEFVRANLLSQGRFPLGVIFRPERNFFEACFPLGGILRAERNLSLSCDFSGGTN